MRKAISRVILEAAAAAAGCLLFTLISCSQEKVDFNSSDDSSVENETTSDGIFSESEDLTSLTVSSDAATAGGRLTGGPKNISIDDPRLQCASITLTPDAASTIFVPKGELLIDFGAGCTDAHGNVRKGIIRIRYNGRRFLPTSSVVTSLEGYEVNGIKIEGVRTVTNTSNSSQVNPSFTTDMAGGQITWPDGTTATRDEHTRRDLRIGASPDLNSWEVTGTATGKNRNDIDYSVTITKKLIYKRTCAINSEVFLPVQGAKDLIVESKKISIDYGDGSCDRFVTVTVRSRSKTVELTGKN